MSAWRHWKRADCKVRFRVKNTKVKVFRSGKPDDDLDPVNAANEILKGTRIDDPTGTNEPPVQADYVVVAQLSHHQSDQLCQTTFDVHRSSKKANPLIGCDDNAKHTFWGSSQINETDE